MNENNTSTTKTTNHHLNSNEDNNNLYTPEYYHVARWSEDPYCLGSWSQLLVNGSPEDRTTLGNIN
jgi:hypothetical protein